MKKAMKLSRKRLTSSFTITFRGAASAVNAASRFADASISGGNA